MLIFTTIQHLPRKKHNLTLNEYCICDMIYHLSNNKKGWCYITKENMAKEIGLSKQSVLSLVQKMIDKGFIEKDEKKKHLRTTQLRYDEFVLVKKVDQDGKESGPSSVKKVYRPGKESLPNNIINNNTKNKVQSTNIVGKIHTKEEAVQVMKNIYGQLDDIGTNTRNKLERIYMLLTAGYIDEGRVREAEERANKKANIDGIKISEGVDRIRFCSCTKKMIDRGETNKIKNWKSTLNRFIGNK